MLLPFVPDSPTASLFFTLALAFLIFDRFRGGQRTGRFAWLRGLIEALAVITSVKYGIWAVAMIIDGAIQGTPLVWEHWMLMVSHSSMALEALLYARFFRMKWMNIAIAAAWTLLNDFIDYGLGVFPWLPDVLLDDLGPIQIFTTTLSLFGIGCAVASKQIPDRNQV